MPAASPIWAVVIEIPLPALVSVLPTAPTMVTSSPSRIHTVPRPITTIRCHRDHGSRSSRAGTSVSTASSPASFCVGVAVTMACIPPPVERIAPCDGPVTGTVAGGSTRRPSGENAAARRLGSDGSGGGAALGGGAGEDVDERRAEGRELSLIHI